MGSNPCALQFQAPQIASSPLFSSMRRQIGKQNELVNDHSLPLD
jgi:hypothetical protein